MEKVSPLKSQVAWNQPSQPKNSLERETADRNHNICLRKDQKGFHKRGVHDQGDFPKNKKRNSLRNYCIRCPKLGQI